jgi:hypothetical protein
MPASKCHFAVPKAALASTLAMAAVLLARVPASAQTDGTRPAEAARLHVIYLAAGADANIGSADKQDIDAMKHIITSTIGRDVKRVSTHDLTGKRRSTGKFWTGQEVLKYIANLKIGPNDNIFIFHSGHGGIANRRRPEETQVLTIDGGNLERKALMKAVADKGPRALILLTDCCSTYMDSPVSLDEEVGDPNARTVANLLLRPTGLISITAADDGQMAQTGWVGDNPANAGSCFSVAMTRLWYRQNVTFNTWKEFFPRLRQETFRVSSSRHRARAFHLGDPLPAPANAAIAGTSKQ